MPREGISSAGAAVSPRTNSGEGRRLDPSTDIIRSRDNRRLKAFRAALRGAGPAPGEPIAVEGPKLVEDGMRAGLQLEALLVSETGERHLPEIFAAARETEEGISRSRIFRTTDKLFAGTAATEAPQGVAALFRQREWTFDNLLHGAPFRDGSFPGGSALVIVLAGVQDPGNVGTILRSAEAFGATGLIATRGTADPWSPKAVRASAASALRLPVLRGLAPTVTLAQLRVANLRIYAAVSGAESRPGSNRQPNNTYERTGNNILDANFADPCAILIGSEGQGLPSDLERSADSVISVPITDQVDSLNAAVAASVLLYEASRQRRLPS